MNRREFIKKTSLYTAGGLILVSGCEKLHDYYSDTGKTVYEPNQLSGLQLWLKADAGIVGNPSVTQWQDQSGNGNHAGLGVSPTYTTNVINGKPALYFNGSTNYLTGIAPGFTGNPSLTVFAVWQQANITVTMNVFLTGTNTTNLGIGIGANNNNNVFFQWGAVSDCRYGPNNTNWVIESGVKGINPNNLHLYINGSQKSQTIVTTTATIGVTNYYVGCAGAGLSNYVNGNVAELVLYNRVLSDTERYGVELYLSNKYGISIA